MNTKAAHLEAAEEPVASATDNRTQRVQQQEHHHHETHHENRDSRNFDSRPLGATDTRVALAKDKMPMGSMMGGKMSMSDKKMMPGMMKGMPMGDHAMMMQMCNTMMPSMSASEKKTMMGMSVAEKKVMMKMCNAMMSKPMASPHKMGKVGMATRFSARRRVAPRRAIRRIPLTQSATRFGLFSVWTTRTEPQIPMQTTLHPVAAAHIFPGAEISNTPPQSLLEVRLHDLYNGTECTGLEAHLGRLPGVSSAHLDRTMGVAF